MNYTNIRSEGNVDSEYNKSEDESWTNRVRGVMDDPQDSNSTDDSADDWHWTDDSDSTDDSSVWDLGLRLELPMD